MRTMLRCSMVSRLFYLVTKPFLPRDLKMRLRPRAMDGEHDWHNFPTWRFNPSPFWTPELARPPHLHSKDEHLVRLVQSDTLKSVRGLSIPISLVSTPTNAAPETGTFRISRNQLWFNQLHFSNLNKLDIWVDELRQRNGGLPEELGDIGKGLVSLSLLRNLSLRGFWVRELPQKLTSFTCTTFYASSQLPELVTTLEAVKALKDLDITFITRHRNNDDHLMDLMEWTGFQPGRIEPSLKRVRISLPLGVPRTRRFQPLLYFLASCSRLEQLELQKLDISFEDLSLLL
jgi:hypothetical protein